MHPPVLFVFSGTGGSCDVQIAHEDTVRVTASDFYSYHRPYECDLRVYLRHKGEKEAPPGPYEEVLWRLAERHERAHLATFPTVLDLSTGTREERERRTREAVKGGSPLIYQAALRGTTTVEGSEVEVVGDPDFLISDSGRYIIRDSKISRRINEKDHPEILRQLELYAWLYEQVFGRTPLRLEVHRGTGDLVEIPYDGGRAALGLVREILRLKQIRTEPYSPVGWTKCGGCGFHGRCWPRAEKEHNVALVSGVDQGLARALHRDGIRTMEDFLTRFDEARLAEYQRPWGRGSQRVGKRAEPILRNARALASGREIHLQPPDLPADSNFVMFDLEGLPAQFDALEKIYLWGLQVYGERPSHYTAATAGFGVDGDREGWEDFLATANGIFEDYGDLPFVHWTHYERSRLDMSIERFGDRDGIAARIHHNLLDLFPITQNALVLPLPSYSLKVVENYLGFKRTLDEAEGQWAMARYIEATETENVKQREGIMGEIRAYNQEDLAATWAVLTWLRGKSANG